MIAVIGLVEAALRYALRGWPVFPCDPTTKRPFLPMDKDKDGKPIRGTGGVKKASTDPDQIRAWWSKWPKAMIGVAVGAAGLLVVDFDPRTDDIMDEATGEIISQDVWTLDRLKAKLTEATGCELPPTLISVTRSGGEHHWFKMPAGMNIGNVGSLPKHIDVRGAGGYVIVAPSHFAGNAEDKPGDYRWLTDDNASRMAELPAALLELMLRPVGKEIAAAPALPQNTRRFAVDVDEAHRRYAMNALDREVSELAATPKGGGRFGGRNQGAYHAAFSLGQFVGAGALSETIVRQSLLEVVRSFDAAAYQAHAGAIENGIENGRAKPRDLTVISTSRRQSGRSSAPGERRPSVPLSAWADRSADDRRNGGRSDDQPSHDGNISVVSALAGAERDRHLSIAAAWFRRAVEALDGTADAATALAFGAGRRSVAGLLDDAAVAEALAKAAKNLPAGTAVAIEQATSAGWERGFDFSSILLTLRCARYALTDFGIAERFRERYGDDYRFTTAKGWLGWDGKRWKELDQDEKTPPAEVIAAVFNTVRLIQREAKLVADTGANNALDGDGKAIVPGAGDAHGLDSWLPKGNTFQLFSDVIRAFGRKSETTGKPAAVALLARQWLTVPIEQFDLDPLAIGVLNGTLRFTNGRRDDGSRWATVELSEHRREDYNTKLAPVEYDEQASAPLYDAMLAWAQPDNTVRRYLHQVGGYGATGLTGEHKLWYNYGRGRNGKSTTIDAWCHVLGDYSGTTLIETFLDQGIKKRGDQASPDLARLGGVRMLRASEPDRDAKLNAALVKFATGGEPVPTRALHRGFFELVPRFKLIMSGNSKPGIPDTDDGIWSRMKLVSWLKNIDLEFNEDGTPKKDPELLDKIKRHEASGVFLRLVQGLLDYLRHGLIEPSSVTADTQAYRDASDPLARFLRECVVPDDKASVQSSILHGVFVAWARAAGEREWTNKGFSSAMTEKGYRKHKSNGMHWLELRLTRAASDFVNDDGSVRVLHDSASGSPRAPPPRPDPDDWPDDIP
ncbi:MULTISPECIES: phage/plasmid primase, P4 family [unclassified Sphingomonas]|uniref:phage/plasmid primase, P4 family n=1 Tax=unclassified Sphingomonas TaxID=196159 RepID=UPI00226AD85B|nr:MULTISPECIES: phage/plasmid primase, P4 family [unclassified Sphingomonas]